MAAPTVPRPEHTLGKVSPKLPKLISHQMDAFAHLLEQAAQRLRPEVGAHDPTKPGAGERSECEWSSDYLLIDFAELSFMAQPGVSPQRLLVAAGSQTVRRPCVMKCTPGSSTPARRSSIKRLRLILNRRAISVEVSHSQVVVMADKEITARPKGLQ